MLNASLGTFFWLSAAYFYLKYTMDVSPYIDFIFLMIIIVFMYFININIMSTKCGSNISVFKATLLPWGAIFGPMIIALLIFPQWKRPFSNTFGYMIARLAGGNNALLELLDPTKKQALHYVYNKPSLLINEFTPDNFNEKIKEMLGEKEESVFIDSPDKIEAFRKIIQLKDIISQWIWFFLTATIVTSTSYSMIMNTECTKSVNDYVLAHNIAMSEVKEKPSQTLYNITE